MLVFFSRFRHFLILLENAFLRKIESHQKCTFQEFLLSIVLIVSFYFPTEINNQKNTIFQVFF